MKKKTPVRLNYKPFRVVRIPKDVADAVERVARRNGRSLTNQTAQFLRQALAANSPAA